MLAAMLHKPSNLSDLAQWKFASNSYKLSMDIPVRASLSPKYRLRDRNLSCLDSAILISWFAVYKWIKSESGENGMEHRALDASV